MKLSNNELELTYRALVTRKMKLEKLILRAKSWQALEDYRVELEQIKQLLEKVGRVE